MTGRSGVLVIAGQTASGKTDLAIDLAQRYGAEIVSADSRQIYRGMPVGTAAPTPSQRAAVSHHLIEFLDPRERYSAAQFAEDAIAAIEAIHARGKRAIVAGGTGFYVRALTGGVELAAKYDEGVRARLAREAALHEPSFLFEWLKLRDPARAAQLHPQDTYRVLRALEVTLAGSARREGPVASLPAAGIPFLKTYVEIEPPVLQQRVAARVDAMLAAGFIAEAERIGTDAVAANAVGYPQAIAYLRGWSTEAEVRALLVRATLRYAKRQATWFRSEPHLQRAPPNDIEALAREKLGWV